MAYLQFQPKIHIILEFIDYAASGRKPGIMTRDDDEMISCSRSGTPPLSILPVPYRRMSINENWLETLCTVTTVYRHVVIRPAPDQLHLIPYG
jgi:hypothetical protein